MTLNSALKQKSRMAGELVRLQAILQRENARKSDSVSTVNRQEVWDKIVNTSNDLGELKGKITIANIGIYPVLEKMSELKSRIAFINSLPKKAGTEVEPTYGNQERITYTWDSFITQEKADELVANLQLEINQNQDLVDQYNSSTNI
jgi:hypothetical protein